MRQVATTSDGTGYVIDNANGPPLAPGAFLYEDGAFVPPGDEPRFPTFAAARECARGRTIARYVAAFPEDAGHADLNTHIDWRTE